MLRILRATSLNKPLITATGSLTADGPFTLTDPASFANTGFYRVGVTKP